MISCFLVATMYIALSQDVLGPEFTSLVGGKWEGSAVTQPV